VPRCRRVTVGEVRLTLVRDRLTWITYGHLAIFAYFLYGFGPAVPLIRDELGISRAVASLHGTALAVGGMVGGTAMPALVRRLGRVRVMWTGQAGLAIAVLALWAAHALPATLAGALFAGLSGTLVVNGVAATLSEHHGPAGSASISEANAVAGAVGVVSPLIVGGTVAVGLGWRPGLAGLVLAVGVLVLITRVFPVSAPARRQPTADGPAVGGRLPRAYWMAWTSLLATASVEVCLTLWMGDVLRTRAGVSPGTAAAALSAMVAGIVIGRLVGVRLLLRFPAPLVLLGALAVSAVGFVVFWLATVPWLALSGLVTCGLGISMHYPLGIALAVRHSDGQPDLAAGRVAYGLGIGFGVAPFALGAVADRIGPHPAFLIILVMLAVSAAAVLRLRALTRDSDPVYPQVAQNEVSGTPSSASRSRSTGSESPTTVP
jgi:predicted MFS family arabinose efflux permease